MRARFVLGLSRPHKAWANVGRPGFLRTFSLRSEQKSASTRLCHLLRQPEGHQACAGCSGLFASCFRMVPHRSWCQALTLRCFRAFDHVPGGPGMATYTAFRLAPWQPRSIWLKAGLCYVTRMALRYRPTSIYELQHGGNIIYEPWRSTETRGVSQRYSKAIRSKEVWVVPPEMEPPVSASDSARFSYCSRCFRLPPGNLPGRSLGPPTSANEVDGYFPLPPFGCVKASLDLHKGGAASGSCGAKIYQPTSAVPTG